jgi:membrane-bound metal-dependent hydrolase YbcI (DUF457 family)
VGRSRVWLYLFVCALSHPLLDALTNGGRGVALLSPFSNHRYFFPWRPIEVSPIGALDLGVLWSEVRWIWLPVGMMLLVRFLRHPSRRHGGGTPAASPPQNLIPNETRTVRGR